MVRLLASGDTALVIEFGETIDREINARVLALADRIWDAKIPGVVETVPTFRSLMVHYDPTRLLFAEIKERVTALLPGLVAGSHIARRWTFPVCYGEDLGPDLEHVATATGLAPEQVIGLHCAEDYHVYCIGFLPGYPYMGDLTPALALPRRETPRVKVPMGSVCIAQRMAGIYPLESPGGWHLLGRTPVRLFDQRRTHAVLLAPGDKVRFQSVTRSEHDRLEALAETGALELTPEVLAA
jgi:KipI family sensor histidine kinase inhibitor